MFGGYPLIGVFAVRACAIPACYHEIMNILGVSVSLFTLVLVIVIAFLIFEVWMFVDALRNPGLSSVERLLWCLGMLVFHPFVAIVYYFVEYY